jgi:ketosteroid isomerase-like protein
MNDAKTSEEVVRAIFAATDGKDTAAKLELITDDVTLTFGNAETVSGKEEFAQASDTFNDSLAAVAHEITGIWTIPGEEDVVLAELRVHYTRLDGEQLTLPCFNTFRLRGGLIADYRIFMDIGPVFA